MLFPDDGIVPNNPRVRVALRSRRAIDKETTLTHSSTNGWGRSWRDAVYDFVHYRSQVHEVLGVARGCAQVEFGGAKGRVLSLKVENVALNPGASVTGSLRRAESFSLSAPIPKKAFRRVHRYPRSTGCDKANHHGAHGPQRVQSMHQRADSETLATGHKMELSG